MITVSIIEDELHPRNVLQKYIDEMPGFEVITTSADTPTSISLINRHKPQLILSDIRLLNGDAFDIFNEIVHDNYELVFITAFDEYALKAFKYGAIDYLLKPVNKAELYTLLEKIAKKKSFQTDTGKLQEVAQVYRQQAAQRITIRTNTTIHFIDTNDIVYCKGDGNYTTFVLKDGERIMATKHMKEYERMLPESIFFRPQQSYIVNGRYVKQMHHDGHLHLTNMTETIPVSTRRKEAVLEFLISFTG